MTLNRIKSTEIVLNALGCIGIIFVLLAALAVQVAYHELPCPLCLLQRVGFTCIALGFLMNLRFGLRPSHYAAIILAALYTGAVALMQMFLNYKRSGGYGTPFLDLYLYTWSFIIALITVIVIALMLGIDRQYSIAQANKRKTNKLAHVLFFALTIVVCMNIFSVFMECGFSKCPDYPKHYNFQTL